MEDKEVFYISEAWCDDYKSLFQVIMYRPETKKKPDINPNLKHLLYKVYYNKSNEIINQEYFY